MWLRIGFAATCAAPISLIAPLALWLATVSLAQIIMGASEALVPLVIAIAGVFGAGCAWAFVIDGNCDRRRGIIRLLGLVSGVISLGIVEHVQFANAVEEVPTFLIVIGLLPIVAAALCSLWIWGRLWSEANEHGES